MSFRIVLRDLSVKRLWSTWTRSFLFNTVVKRIKRDRSVREVIQCFRQTVLRPRRTLLLSTTAAFKANEGDSVSPPSCEENITDDELQALANEVETIEELSKSTLFCPKCGKRMVIEKKLPGVQYCTCKDAQALHESLDGWLPYMEAEDVIIWRKEYKPGQGLYAYKVHGRYKDVAASDFAAVQVDGAYRRVWDTAVAALSVVERNAGGMSDQAVLHWEVLWPRLFANRDYVYIRRHKDFDVKLTSPLPRKEGLFNAPPSTPPPVGGEERPNVHSNAKRKSRENEAKEMGRGELQENKIFVIISRSCVHPAVPESKNAIRVSEYWSHMVVRSLDGVEKPGMEFVLTYYDEPAVGGLPSGVATWATGRAAPAYLERMRRAAGEYAEWRNVRANQELPDYVSFNQQQGRPCFKISEEEMESSKHGPELENSEDIKTDKSTQTETESPPIDKQTVATDNKPTVHIQSQQSEETRANSTTTEFPPVKKSNQSEESKANSTTKETTPVKKSQQSEESKSNSSTKETTPVKESQQSEKSKANPTTKETPPVKKDETPLGGDSEKPEEEDSGKTNTGVWWRHYEEDGFLIP